MEAFAVVVDQGSTIAEVVDVVEDLVDQMAEDSMESVTSVASMDIWLESVDQIEPT